MQEDHCPLPEERKSIRLVSPLWSGGRGTSRDNVFLPFPTGLTLPIQGRNPSREQVIAAPYGRGDSSPLHYMESSARLGVVLSPRNPGDQRGSEDRDQDEEGPFLEQFGALRELGWRSEDSEYSDISRASRMSGVKPTLYVTLMIEAESTGRTHREATFGSVQRDTYICRNVLTFFVVVVDYRNLHMVNH